MKKSILAFLILFLPVITFSQSVEGLWKTIDDETGKAKSIVKIYKSDGKLYGQIVKLINQKPGEVSRCTECTGKNKDKPIEGMIIIFGLEKSKGKWKGDDGILDPEKGQYYNCRIWAESDKRLKVRGYIGPLYRTQNWIRYK